MGQDFTSILAQEEASSFWVDAAPRKVVEHQAEKRVDVTALGPSQAWGSGVIGSQWTNPAGDRHGGGDAVEDEARAEDDFIVEIGNAFDYETPR